MGMAGAGAAQGGGRRRRRGRKFAPMADINMTPFIDVMLVLLIIFMVAAPLLTVGVPLDLPQTQAKALNIDQKPVTLSVDERGRIFLNENEIQEAQIVVKLTETARLGFEERIYLRGHKKVDYGRVAQVMAIVTTAGFKKVALITESDKGL